MRRDRMTIEGVPGVRGVRVVGEGESADEAAKPFRTRVWMCEVSARVRDAQVKSWRSARR